MADFQVSTATSGAHVRPDLIHRGGSSVIGNADTQLESVVSDATRSALVFHGPGTYSWLIPSKGDAASLTVTCQLWRGPSVVVRPKVHLLGPAGAKATTTMPDTASTWETVAVTIPIKGTGVACFIVERPQLLVTPFQDYGNLSGWVVQSLPVNNVIQDRTIRARNPRRVEVRFPTSGAIVFG